MRTSTRLIIMLLVAGASGLGSALYLSGSYGAQSNGPWRILPTRVMPNQSPYALAHFALKGALSPDTNQMVVFTATADSDGNTLDADCAYAIAGTLPLARWWSLSVADHPAASLSSGNVIKSQDEALSVHVSASAKPGNWLVLPTLGKFGLVLRFHGPTGVLKDEPSRAALPSIRKGECT